MSLDDVGYGAGGGFLSGVIATIATAFGFKSRIDKLEKAVMYRDVFDQFEKRFDTAMEKIDRMDSKIDTLLTRRRDDKQRDGIV